MMDLPAAARFIVGDFAELDVNRRHAIAEYLEAVWFAQFNSRPGSLAADLDRLAAYYSPKLTPKALRALADQLAPITLQRPAIDSLYVIVLDSGRALITPEGRGVLELARWHMDLHFNSEDRLLSIAAELIHFYGAPRRDWMRKTLTGGDLRPASLGYVVFLLLNGSIGKEHAMRLPKATEDEQRLANTVVPVANAFAVGIGGSPLSGRELTRLRSNWAVSEAGRQLPGIVRNESDAPRVSYIDSMMEKAAIEAVATSVSSRRKFDVTTFPGTLRATHDVYQEARPLLLTWGMCWSTDAHTAAVLADLDRMLLKRVREAAR